MKRIYFIKPIGLPGPIKIGASVNFYGRLDQINLWSPIPLELIGTIEGQHEDELFLHQSLFDSHSHGEWFFPTTKVVETIAGVLKHGMSYARENLHPVGSHRSKMVSARTRELISKGVRKARESAKPMNGAA